MNWIERQARAFAQRPDLFPKGEIGHTNVRHDDWCKKLVQGGFCDCIPDIDFDHKGTRYAITKHGSVVKIGGAD